MCVLWMCVLIFEIKSEQKYLIKSIYWEHVEFDKKKSGFSLLPLYGCGQTSESEVVEAPYQSDSPVYLVGQVKLAVMVANSTNPRDRLSVFKSLYAYSWASYLCALVSPFIRLY